MGQEKDDLTKEQLAASDKVACLSKAKLKSSTSRKSSLDFRKYTKQIWLAGLGAFSRAEEEGNKLFDSLVKVGEELESSSQQGVDHNSDKAIEKQTTIVADKKEKVEKILDHGVNHSLNRIGLVTAKDLQHLEGLILQLHHKVDSLAKESQDLKSELRKNNPS